MSVEGIKPKKIASFENICPEGQIVLDFTIDGKYLIASSTDQRVRFLELSTGDLVISAPIEGMATSLCFYENMDFESDMAKQDKLGQEYSYLALGMVHYTSIYRFNYRYKTLTFLKMIYERPKRLLKLNQPDMRITDLKFWKRYRLNSDCGDAYDRSYFIHEPDVYLSICVHKCIKILTIPQKREAIKKARGPRKDLAITEMVIGGKINVATVDKQEHTVYSETTSGGQNKEDGNYANDEMEEQSSTSN